MSFTKSPDSCASNAQAITPADTDLTAEARALYVGGSGDVKVTTTNGDVVTFANVVAGSILPVSVKRVWAATTASSIIGLS